MYPKHLLRKNKAIRQKTCMGFHKLILLLIYKTYFANIFCQQLATPRHNWLNYAGGDWPPLPQPAEVPLNRSPSFQKVTASSYSLLSTKLCPVTQLVVRVLEVARSSTEELCFHMTARFYWQIFFGSVSVPCLTLTPLLTWYAPSSSDQTLFNLPYSGPVFSYQVRILLPETDAFRKILGKYCPYYWFIQRKV